MQEGLAKQRADLHVAVADAELQQLGLQRQAAAAARIRQLDSAWLSSLLRQHVCNWQLNLSEARVEEAEEIIDENEATIAALEEMVRELGGTIEVLAKGTAGSACVRVLARAAREDARRLVRVWESNHRLQLLRDQLREQAYTTVAAVGLQAKTAAVRLFRLVLAYPIKGLLSVCLARWRDSMRMVSEGVCSSCSELNDLIETVDSQRRQELCGAALRQLVIVLARMTRGQVGGCVAEWREKTKEASRGLIEDGLNEMIDEVDSRMRDDMRSAALLQMRRVLVGFLEVTSGTLIHNWRASTCVAVAEREFDLIVQQMESQMRILVNKAALQQLHLILASLLGAEVRARLQLWKASKNDAADAGKQGGLLDLIDKLEDKMRTKTQCAAIRQLVLALYRLMRGELGMRVQVWRMKRMHGLRGAMQRAFGSTIDQCRAHQLTSSIIRLDRQQLVVRVALWRDAKNEGVRLAMEHGFGAMVDELMGRMELSAQMTAVRQLRLALVRIVCGMLTRLVQRWVCNSRVPAAAQPDLSVPLGELQTDFGLLCSLVGTRQPVQLEALNGLIQTQQQVSTAEP